MFSIDTYKAIRRWMALVEVESYIPTGLGNYLVSPIPQVAGESYHAFRRV